MFLSLLVFWSGTAVMILEIVASRFFAPYIGTSVYVWTALIGIVMAGLSAGYALGGYLGDTWKSLQKLQIIIMIVGFWILALGMLRDALLLWLSITLPSIILTAVIGSVVLLLIPSMLLGMVSPYAVRLAALDIRHIGRTAGRLAAISTVGSILGTFLTGFVLIPLIDISTMLLALSFSLVIIPAFRPNYLIIILLFVYAVCALPIALVSQVQTTSMLNSMQGIIDQRDTAYSVVRVRELIHEPTKRPYRLMEINNGHHGAAFMDNPDDHVFTYSRPYETLSRIRSDTHRALLLGGGTYTLAYHFLKGDPKRTVDAVEIDPLVTEIARTYFPVPADRLTIHHEDARTFLNRTTNDGHYHIVFGDTFQSTSSIPFHLTTLSAVRHVARLLDDDGLYVLNVIGDLTGTWSTFVSAEWNTLNAVFPHIAVLPMESPYAPPRNILLIASKQPLPRDIPGTVAFSPTTDLILTDTFAPVETMMRL